MRNEKLGRIRRDWIAVDTEMKELHNMSLRDVRTGRVERYKPARRTSEPRPMGTRQDERGLMEQLLDEWAEDMSGEYDIFAD